MGCLWWRTGVHDPNHRPLSRPYSFAFLITTLLFIGSIFVALFAIVWYPLKRLMKKGKPSPEATQGDPQES